MRKSVLCAITLTILAPVSAAQAQTAYGLQGSDRIVTFDAATPGTIVSNQAITGLGAGEALTGIDIRPADGQIYTLATSGNLYSLSSGGGSYAATLVGNIATPIIGSNFGIDFNPVPDRLRFVSDGDQNLRINPNNGVAIVDGSINPTDLNLIGSAYINNFAGTTATTLYGIDSLTASLVRSTNPNAGSYVSVGSLGFGPDIGADARVGFDVFTNFGVNTAFLALNNRLYTVDLDTGAATAVGAIGAENIRGLTLQLGLVPEPSTWAMMICGFGLVGAVLRRRPAGRPASAAWAGCSKFKKAGRGRESLL